MMNDIMDLFDMLIAYHMNINLGHTGIAHDIKEDLFKLFYQERVEKMGAYLHELSHKGAEYKAIATAKSKEKK